MPPAHSPTAPPGVPSLPARYTGAQLTNCPAQIAPWQLWISPLLSDLGMHRVKHADGRPPSSYYGCLPRTPQQTQEQPQTWAAPCAWAQLSVYFLGML